MILKGEASFSSVLAPYTPYKVLRSGAAGRTRCEWDVRMRVALVSAPYDSRRFRIGENLGIKYLAAVLEEDGVQVDVVEPVLLGVDNAEVARRLLAVPYDLIGFSIMFDSALPNVLDIVKQLRGSGCPAHLTIGGHVPTFWHLEILRMSNDLDSVVRFEGERTLTELVGRLAEPDSWSSILGLTYRRGDAIVVNKPRPLIADLDSLPFPKRDETSRHLGDPHFFVITTRGCPFACTFCSIPAFYKTPPGSAWRARSIDNVLHELARVAGEWGVTTVSLLDDEFLVGRHGKRRATSLAEGLLSRGPRLTWSFECRVDDVSAELFGDLRAGGLRHVFLGVESGVQRVLDMFQKRTTVEQNRHAIETVRELGLSLATGFIMFDPFTTIAELRSNIAFMQDMHIGSYKAASNKVQVYRGTGLEKELARQGRLVRDGFLQDFVFEDPRVRLVFDLVCRNLAPCHDADIARRKVEFLIDHAGDDPQARQSRQVFHHLDLEASRFLADTLRMVVGFAERHAGAPPKTLARFERELRDGVESGVAEQLLAVRRLGDGLRDRTDEGGESHVG